MVASPASGWFRNRRTNPELDAIRADRSIASIAILGSLLLHLLLAWVVLRHAYEEVRPGRILSVTLVRVPPPPPPKPRPVEKPVAASPPPVPKPVPQAAPGPVALPKPKALAQQHSTQERKSMAKTIEGPPVMHFGAAGAAPGLGLDLGTPSGGGGSGHGSIGAFDDEVKSKIEAAKTYPPGIPYMWNECVVEYQVTVDASGNLLNYKLYGCNDPFLDSAARAAILMASPFPVPPDFGGSHYTVFGSLVFKHH
jgi:periplasmic protein TonB